MDQHDQLRFVQRRWKEVLIDLATERGISANALLQKIPAFAADTQAGQQSKEIGRVHMSPHSMTKSELEICRIAHDTIAEILIAITRKRPNPSNRRAASAAER
jgi:hypothetical protein